MRAGEASAVPVQPAARRTEFRGYVACHRNYLIRSGFSTRSIREEIQTIATTLLSAPAAFAPLLEGPLPDPYVLRMNEEWHIFGTGQFCYRGRSLAPDAMRRSDFSIDFGPETSRVRCIWGFTPYRDSAGCDHAYATLHYGRFRTVVAHFLPARGETWNGGPIRRWKLNRVVIGNFDAARATAYESKPFTGEDGCLYLMYSASPAPHRDVNILVQRMLDAATPDPSFRPRPLLTPQGYRSEDRNPGYIQIVEGASIARIGHMYVLLYSAGDFARNNYKLGVAFSTELIPAEGRTYSKALIQDPRNVWRNNSKGEEVCYLLQSEHKGWPNYCGHLVRGPGLGNLVKIGDEYRLIFHGYRPEDRRRRPNDRYVWMIPLAVEIREDRPASQWIRPVLPRVRQS